VAPSFTQLCSLLKHKNPDFKNLPALVNSCKTALLRGAGTFAVELNSDYNTDIVNYPAALMPKQ